MSPSPVGPANESVRHVEGKGSCIGCAQCNLTNLPLPTLLSLNLMSYLTGNRPEVEGTPECEIVPSDRTQERRASIPSVTWARPVRRSCQITVI